MCKELDLLRLIGHHAASWNGVGEGRKAERKKNNNKSNKNFLKLVKKTIQYNNNHRKKNTVNQRGI